MSHRRRRIAIFTGLLLAPLVTGSTYLGLTTGSAAQELLQDVRLGDHRDRALATLERRGLSVTELTGPDGGSQLLLGAIPEELAVDEARVPGLVVVHIAGERVSGISAVFDGGDDPVFLFDELAARWADRLGRPELDQRWMDDRGRPGLQVEWSSPHPSRITLEDGSLRLGTWLDARV